MSLLTVLCLLSLLSLPSLSSSDPEGTPDVNTIKLREQRKQRAHQKLDPNSHAQKEFQRLKTLNDHLGAQHDYYASASLPPPLQMLSFQNFSDLPVEMAKEERQGTLKCSYLGSHCPMENVEHRLVDRFIKPEDSVLEVSLFVLTFVFANIN
jgi:hypothetical protein